MFIILILKIILITSKNFNLMKLCMELYRLHYVSRVFGVRMVFATGMKKAVTKSVTA